MRLVSKLGMFLLLAVAVNLASAGELIDRLVATVENTPILQSDWERAIGLELLEQGKPPGAMGVEERRAVMQRLVDQQLLRKQMGDENIAAAEERDVARQLEKIRSDFPEAKSDEDWHKLLAKYGIEEDALHRDVARQLQILRFVDLRLRPESRVAREEIEKYYNDTLLPEVRRRGGKEQSLAEVSPQIEEILRQQRIDSLLNTWLQDLRSHSDIQWLGSVAGSPVEDNAVATSGGD